jgi:hypothetical protein
MSIKKLKVLGFILAFLLCFPMHFVYDKFPSFVSSVFFPVNESIWEHMKLLFGSIILSGVIQKMIVLKKKLNFNNICFSNFIAAISCIVIFLILFLPIYYIFGHNLVVTIIIMFISIGVSEFISYLIIKCKNFKLENITIFFVFIVYVIFLIFTYFPLNFDLFIDPISKVSGITK